MIIGEGVEIAFIGIAASVLGFLARALVFDRTRALERRVKRIELFMVKFETILDRVDGRE